MSNIFSAGIDALVTFFPDAVLSYTDFRIGGLDNLSMEKLLPAFWVILVALLLLFSCLVRWTSSPWAGRPPTAWACRVKPLRLVLLALAAALAGAAVSFAGLLGFVGLIVPHIMRRTVGEDSLPLLLACAWGAHPCSPCAISSPGCCSLPMRSRWASFSPWRGGPSSSGCSCGREEGEFHDSAARGLRRIRGPLVVQDVTLDLIPGEVLVLLGPNGCGKSTLLRVTAGLQPPAAGQVLVDGALAQRLSRRQLAQRITYLPQSRSVPNITAYRMVLHGRFPYLSYPRRYRPEDHAAARRALEQADAWDLAGLPVQTLSGGQRQKVYLAMALAQDTQTILMDEPTTYLDVPHQLELLDFAQAWPGRARQWCWSFTTCAWPCGLPTGEPCWTGGTCFRRAPRRSCLPPEF